LTTPADTAPDAAVGSGVLLTDPDEALFRQIHPKHLSAGVISSEAFVPSPRDKDMLSTLRERIGPEAAYGRWVDAGYESIGTYAVTVGEAIGAGLQIVDDEADTEPDHASIDFSALASKGQKKQTGRRLRDAAVERGCQYTPLEAAKA
jgi:hypothetical protein